MPDMTVRADALDITESGAVISFVGRVAALIDDKPANMPRPAPQPSERTPAPVIPTIPDDPPAGQVPSAAQGAEALQPAGPTGGARSVAIIDPATGQARAPAPASR